jgi:2-dehydropantoate 2-reductase
MRVGVFGTGGVGGYFGGRLAQSGVEVVFIARGEHLKALQASGLKVESDRGDFWLKSVQAIDDPQDAGKVDAILLGVKAWQVAEAAREMRPMVGPDTFVVPLQNGVEAPAQLVEVLGEQHVVGGLCWVSSFISSPGQIRQAGIEPHVAFGELDNRLSQRCQSLLRAFQEAGVKAEIPADIQVTMWKKFTFITAISGVGGVTRAPVGVTRSLPETRQLSLRVMQEIQALAKAYQINLPPAYVSETMTFIDGLPEGTQPSMQRDIVAGRPSELAYQNGAVVRLAQEPGVPVPINEFIYDCLLPQERKARGELNY